MTPLNDCRRILNTTIADDLAKRALGGEEMHPDHIKALGAFLLSARVALRDTVAMVDCLEAEVVAEASIARGDGFVWTPEP